MEFPPFIVLGHGGIVLHHLDHGSDGQLDVLLFEIRFSVLDKVAAKHKQSVWQSFDEGNLEHAGL